MASTRRGDFTHKQYIYKVYENGFNNKRKHYLTPDGITGHMNWETETTGSHYAGLSFIDYHHDVTPSGHSIAVEGAGSGSFFLAGTGKITSDAIRLTEIRTSDLKFKQSYTDNNEGIQLYSITVFDYSLVFDPIAGTVEAFHDSTSLGTDTLSSDYDYIRMYESGGIFYLDNSDDGVSWTNFVTKAIDFSSDITRGRLSLFVEFGNNGNASTGRVDIEDITWLRHDFGFKGIIDKVTDELEFTTHVNTPASSTTVKINEDPLNLPEYIKNGAFIDVYVNYWSYLAFGQEDTILDHNDQPILDHNDQPITGFFSGDLFPERDSWLRFSGYIDSMELDYDAKTVVLGLVSHGEEAANTPAITGEKATIPVQEQTLSTTNESISSNNRRQTFTLDRVQKLSGVELYISAGSGSAISSIVNVYFGQGATTLGVATGLASLTPGIFQFFFPEDIVFEAGTYWFRPEAPSGGSWQYQNTDVYEGGARQTLSGGIWSNTTTDAYFRLLLNNPEIDINYTSQNIQDIVADAFDVNSSLPQKGSLKRAYSQITMGQVDDLGQPRSLQLRINTIKDMFEGVHGQSLLGWWWSIDPGTIEYTLQAPGNSPEHIFYAGKDMLAAVIKKDIRGIVNDVYFIGATINDAQDTLTTQTTDRNSIVNYRRGLNIKSDGRVSRYDTAQAFSDFEIASNNGQRISTSITIQAKTYDIETIRVGHLCRLVNMGGQSIDLTIASVSYSPYSVTLSLSNLPSTLLRSIDSIAKSLEEKLTQDASNAI